MTSELHARAKAVVGAMTKGPWVWRTIGGEHQSLFADHGRRDVILCDARTRNDRGLLVRASGEMPNMGGIAFLRNTADAALAVIEAARATLGLAARGNPLFCDLDDAIVAYDAALRQHFEREGT